MDAEPEISTKARLPWPLISIDFEASALGVRGYPIEVGIARWQSLDHDIETWSALIRPTAGWLEGGVWSNEAENVHSIGRSELNEGLLPRDVMTSLNSLVTASVCWCDGGAQDDFWLGQLAYAAGVAPAFKLGDWDALGGALQSTGYEQMVRWLDRSTPRHRAGDDAERLMRALSIGLKGGYGQSRPISWAAPGDAAAPPDQNSSEQP